MNLTTKDVSSESNGQNTESIVLEGSRIPLAVLTISYPLAKIANILLWIGEAIIIFIKIDWLQLRAADLKYFAGILIMIAAKCEGQEVGAYTGKIPEENPAKVIGTIFSEAGASILLAVLRSEITRENKPSNAPVIAPFIGGVGAVQ